MFYQSLKRLSDTVLKAQIWFPELILWPVIMQVVEIIIPSYPECHNHRMNVCPLFFVFILFDYSRSGNLYWNIIWIYWFNIVNCAHRNVYMYASNEELKKNIEIKKNQRIFLFIRMKLKLWSLNWNYEMIKCVIKMVRFALNIEDCSSVHYMVSLSISMCLLCRCCWFLRQCNNSMVGKPYAIWHLQHKQYGWKTTTSIQRLFTHTIPAVR